MNICYKAAAPLSVFHVTARYSFLLYNLIFGVCLFFVVFFFFGLFVFFPGGGGYFCLFLTDNPVNTTNSKLQRYKNIRIFFFNNEFSCIYVTVLIHVTTVL